MEDIMYSYRSFYFASTNRENEESFIIDYISKLDMKCRLRGVTGGQVHLPQHPPRLEWPGVINLGNKRDIPAHR